MKTKRCIQCGEEKLLGSFHRLSKKNDTRQAICGRCRNERSNISRRKRLGKNAKEIGLKSQFGRNGIMAEEIKTVRDQLEKMIEMENSSTEWKKKTTHYVFENTTRNWFLIEGAIAYVKIMSVFPQDETIRKILDKRAEMVNLINKKIMDSKQIMKKTLLTFDEFAELVVLVEKVMENANATT